MTELVAVLEFVIIWAFKWAMFFIVIGVFISYLISITPYGRDDSDDGKWFGKRSGFRVMTDHRTGLQYLVTVNGGITPRLDLQGKQCTEVKDERTRD